MNLTFHPVTKNRWTDFESLFECRGGPHYCWCMLWRVNENKKSLPGKVGKKASMKRRVDENIPIGLLAYHDDHPIAWCSVAPKDTYRKLGGDTPTDTVWSIVCFFVKREFRKRGVTSQLLAAAVDFATVSGAQRIEAYPVKTDSPTYRFLGLVPMFAKAGFKRVTMAGSRRHVMSLDVT